jgi:multidrug efflux pump subunit AcrB
MSRFAIRTPYFIVVLCLIICVVGGGALVRMPVDLFPPINIPVVVVATFYAGMPPEQIEANITSRYERFFTLAANIEHIESRSLAGVSVIKIHFQPGSDANAAVGAVSNLAMANLRRLPAGTLPPIVLKFDASSLPVCLVTFKTPDLNETQIRDLAQYNVRNQLASVPGASVPQPFGGGDRSIMIFADPNRLEAYQMSLMDMVRGVNDANLTLPAGNVKIGPFDYNIYTNSQLNDVEEINSLPIKVSGTSVVRVGDIAKAKDGNRIQTNVVRVDGNRGVYVPILKQGGDSNTIAVVDGIKEIVNNLIDVPDSLVTKVAFDQSEFVKTAIETLLHEGAIGLFLTSALILVFLGSFRATIAVCFSIPISALATFMLLQWTGGTVNTMVLGGLALAFSRLIDNSVVVLENIYRHLEMGSDPVKAAEEGGREVALPVLSATLTTVIVFFPVTFLFGVSRFLFSALALAVVLALAASYFVAMTVVPLFCARYIHTAHSSEHSESLGAHFNQWFNHQFARFLHSYQVVSCFALDRPRLTLLLAAGAFGATLFIAPLIGMSYFPRTDAGQFVMNVKAPAGSRIEVVEALFARAEELTRKAVGPEEVELIVSNIGISADISAIYTPNSAPHTGFIQVALKKQHKVGSYEHMARTKEVLEREMPELQIYFQSGGLVDSVLNMGMAAPINVQVTSSSLQQGFATASSLAAKIRMLPGAAGVFMPQDLDTPSLRLQVNRTRAIELGLSEREVVQNVITALTSNQMIAPSYWVDPKSGRDYLLLVQYPEGHIKSIADLKAVSLRGPGSALPTRLDAVSTIEAIKNPAEVSHYQIRRNFDIYVQPKGEDLNRLTTAIERIISAETLPRNLRVDLRGSVQAMRQSFSSFGLGLMLASLLLYLILVAQFSSFIDPLIILLAVPPGLSGVLLTLWLTDTTLNVMSLMGIVMLVGIAVSNSILIVEFARQLIHAGVGVREAISTACKVRLRPVLMTSLATIFGLAPMALKIGQGSEAYAPLARAILGGLALSVLFTVFIVPAAYLLVHQKKATS